MNNRINTRKAPPPPPPASLGGDIAMTLFTAPVRNVLLCCLFLMPFLAAPVQSQSCGLPSSRTTWTSATTPTTWDMTANCTFSTSAGFYLRVASGTFTINGNGYTINTDNDARAFHIQSSGTLNINNVTITGKTSNAARTLIDVAGRFNATAGVIIRDNTANAAINVAGSGARADLTNIRILNTTGSNAANASSAIRVGIGTTVNLENAYITGNSRSGYVIGVYGTGTLNVRGCLTMSGNNGTAIASHSGGQGTPTINNNNIGACVGGGFTTATPTPLAGTATALAMTAVVAGTATAEAEGTATAEAEGTATAEAEMTGTAAAEMTGTAAAAMPGTATAAAAAAGTATAEAEMTGTAAAAAEGTATAAAAETATVLAMTATATPTATPTPEPRTSKKKAKDPLRPTPTATPRPAYAASYVALQTETGMTFEAAYGLESGVHFRQLDGGGIGVQSIIDAGPLAALDVYGYVEQGVEVCFPQIGRVIFLDARTMPRAITTLPATVRDGMTCVYLNSPGSLVLLPN